jgi:hypothetical protein
VAEPHPVPSGFSLVGARVAFGDPEGASHPAGTAQFVPWPNLERIGGGAAG